MIRSKSFVKSDQKRNLLLAMANRREVVWSGSEAILAETPLLRKASLENGLIVVPRFPNSELLRPSASGFSEGGQIRAMSGTKDLFGEGFRLTRIAVPRDHTLWRQLREAGEARRNHGQARRQSLHQGNRQTFIDGREHEQIKSGEKTRHIETCAVEEDAIRDAE